MAGAGRGTMTPERWCEVKDALGQLLTLDGASREAFLRALPEDVRRDAEPFLEADLAALADLLPMNARDGAAARITSAQDPDPESEVLASRYRIVRMLGRGGMGTVELAHDLLLDCPVAIKRVRDLWIEDREARRRLLREGRALAALNHPGIARVHDVLDTSPPALVMEFVDGESLGAWLDQRRAAADVLAVLRQVAEAVAYAHDKGVVHCDLKPRNVLVTPEGRAKVVDFGISLVISRAATTTVNSDTTRHPAFTPKYAAPEVVRGATPSPASDVFSLGVLIEEVLAGCVRAGQPLPRGLATALLGVALRARSEAPQDRYRDGAALLRALEASAPTADASRSTRWYSAVMAVLLLIAGCLNGGLSLSGKSPPPRRPVVAVAARVDPAALPTLSASLVDAITSDLARLANIPVVSNGAPVLSAAGVADLLAEARKLGITHVIVPTVRDAREALSTTLSVYEVASGQLRWSRTVGVTEATLFDRQEQLTKDLVTDLRWGSAASARVAGGVQAPGTSPRALAYYSQARTFLERIDLPANVDHAIDLLQKAIAVEPRFAAAHASLGRAFWARYDTTRERQWADRAASAFEQARVIDPTDVPVRLLLARYALGVGTPAEAELLTRGVLAAHENNDEAQALLGAALSETGRHGEAVAALRRAVALRPGFSPHVRALATAHFDAGDLASAEAQFRELTTLQPDSVYAWQNLATVLHMTGRTSEAVACYERALAIRPIASAHTNIGVIAFADGDFARAVREFRAAVTLSPTHAVYRRNLADGLRKLGRTADARREYAQAHLLATEQLAVKPGDIRLMAVAAVSAAALGQHTEAERLARRAIATSGGNHAPRLTLAVVHAWAGQVNHTREALREAFRAGAPLEQALQDDTLVRVLGAADITRIHGEIRR